MAFFNNKYEYISYDCSDIINDLEDLRNKGFKGNIICYYSWEDGVKIFKDYDLVTYGSNEENSLNPSLLTKFDGYDSFSIDDSLRLFKKERSLL